MSHALHTETSQTSSIGAVWPPEPGPHERLRGFYDQGIVESSSDCKDFAEQFDYYRATLGETSDTRLSIRLVAHAAQLSTPASLEVPLEAAIPLAGTDGLVLAYAAANIGERNVDAGHLRQHAAILQKVIESRPRDERNKADVLRANGYEPRIVTAETSEGERTALESKFLDMYSIFGYDEDDVRRILHDVANTIVYVEDNGAIVSTAMAERASIPITGFGLLNLVEITEASTHPDYRRHGLYKAVSGLLIQRLISRQDNDTVHAVYGESNLAMLGVLFAGHENGRNFSHFDSVRLGVDPHGFGILQQNFRIEDGEEHRRYNDFAVSYVPLPSTGGN